MGGGYAAISQLAQYFVFARIALAAVDCWFALESFKGAVDCFMSGDYLGGALCTIVGLYCTFSSARNLFSAYKMVAGRIGANAASAATANATQCFTGETLVAMEDGHKRIDEIKVGDKVWAYNPETGEEELKEVVNVYVKETDEILHLETTDGDIDTTTTHPFYVIGQGWTAAGDLKIGDEVYALDGTTVTITAVRLEKLNKTIKVYNLEVAEFHTYFVGSTGILVHNSCGTKGGNGSKVDDIKQLIKDGKVVDNNIISNLDDNTQVIFRNDTGNNAHPIKSKGYFDKVDHYNVEIQTKTKAGKWKSKWSFHIIFDEKGNIIDTFD